MKLVGIGLLALGSVRLFVAAKGSFSLPVGSGYDATYQFEPASNGSKAVTLGIIGAGLLLVLGGRL